MDTTDENFFNNLFSNSFDKIKNYEENKKIFQWKNALTIFDKIIEKLLICKELQSFIKNYYQIVIFYVSYVNYLKYINHPDYEKKEVYNFLNKIKYNEKILFYLKNNSSNNTIKNIFQSINPFIKVWLEKSNDNNYELFFSNVKQLDNLYLSEKFEIKKILNIILHRYILSSNLDFNNFNDFFIKNTIDDSLNLQFFDDFIKNIPNLKNIISMNVNHEIKNKLNFSLTKLINHIIGLNKLLKLQIITEPDGKYFELVHEKIIGKIIIKKSINKENNINLYQQNLNLMTWNIKELKNIPAFKKTNNFIVIQYSSSIINDLSTLLHLTHLITQGIKLLESCPSSIVEYLYPIDYSMYYYDSFVNFLSFIKNKINHDMSYNRFLIDLIKFYYMYSYYDYYFYYNTNLIKTIVSRIKFKNDIFSEFCTSLKYLFKLPTEMTKFPPFFNVEDDIDNPIYYSIETPNYFKFYDLICAIDYVFNNKSINTKLNVLKILSNIKHSIITNITPIPKINNNKQKDEQIKEIEQIKLINKQDDNVSKYTNNLANDDISLVNNNNAFVELNIENSCNYALNTEF